MFTDGINQEKSSHFLIDFYTTRGVAPWWSVERTHILRPEVAAWLVKT